MSHPSELDEALAGLEAPLRRYREGLERWRKLASPPPAAADGFPPNVSTG